MTLKRPVTGRHYDQALCESDAGYAALVQPGEWGGYYDVGDPTIRQAKKSEEGPVSRSPDYSSETSGENVVSLDGWEE